MKIELKLGAATFFCSAFSLIGCAATDESEHAPATDAFGSESVATSEDGIFSVISPGSTRSRQRGAVQICFDGGGCCSGSLLNNGLVLTAAHCLPVPNRNRSHAVEITYEPPKDPNAPFCLPEYCPDPMVWRLNMFFYHHPNQKEPDKKKIAPPYDIAVGAICTSTAAPCYGGSVQTFGLDNKHFVTLSTRKVADNNQVTMFAYGAPDVDHQHRLSMRVSSGGDGDVHYHPFALGYYICQGDSGAPLLRNTGYSDGLGSFWNAQAIVHSGALIEWGDDPDGTYFQRPDGTRIYCSDRSRGSAIRNHINWIQEISTFWTNNACTSVVTPNGENVRRCF